MNRTVPAVRRLLGVGGVALALGLPSGPSHGALLCVGRNGRIRVRDVCKPREAPLSADATGIVGARGPKGDPGPPGPPGNAANLSLFVSGTRLRARYLVADDGTRQWSGWYDDERDEECNFTPPYYRASDGTVRCLPRGVPLNTYADPMCMQPVAAVFPTSRPPCPVKYGIAETSTCPVLFTVYTVSPYTPSSLYVGGPESCDPYPIDLNAYTFYRADAVVPAAMFVQAVEKTE